MAQVINIVCEHPLPILQLASLCCSVFMLITLGHFNSVQEKAANAMVLASDHVRWVMGPSGTTVTFPDEMGLPSIFDSKPCRYEFLSYIM